VVAVTYQGPYKHNYGYSAVAMTIKQRRMAPLRYASQPKCQCMAIHGGGNGLTKKDTRHELPKHCLGNLLASSKMYNRIYMPPISRVAITATSQK